MVNGHLPLKTLVIKTTPYGSEELVGGSIVRTFARSYKCMEEESMISKMQSMREGLGMSKCAFAKKLGVSEGVVRKWEAKGTGKAQAGVLLKAARVLGVPVEELIDEED